MILAQLLQKNNKDNTSAGNYIYFLLSFYKCNAPNSHPMLLLVVFFLLCLYSYEFKVKPKNELGTGPLSEPVSFNTESGMWLSICFTSATKS